MQPSPAPATDYTVTLDSAAPPTNEAIPTSTHETPSFVDSDDAEKEREDAFNSDHFFNGKLLHGFSITRDALWHRLRAGWPQLPALSDDDYANLPIEVTEPEAWITLFLCSHTPEDWADYRHDTKLFITKIETWIDANITSREEQLDAITLGLKIRRQSRANLATARNSGGTSGK